MYISEQLKSAMFKKFSRGTRHYPLRHRPDHKNYKPVIGSPDVSLMYMNAQKRSTKITCVPVKLDFRVQEDRIETSFVRQ
jgi:hypothetical protein